MQRIFMGNFRGLFFCGIIFKLFRSFLEKMIMRLKQTEPDIWGFWSCTDCTFLHLELLLVFII